MSFNGLVLTRNGQKEMMKAIDGESLTFSHIAFGDGNATELYNLKEDLSSEICQLPITDVERNEDKIILSIDYTNKSFSKGFYFRELGVIGNGKLCYYDNSGADAEYIDPNAESVSKEKRLRIEITVSDEAKIETTAVGGLYVLENLSYSPAEELKPLVSGEKMTTALAKIAKAVTSLIMHLADKAVHITDVERKSWNSKAETNGSNATGDWNINITGNAETATKLKTARTVRTNLGSTSTANFDGTSNAEPGVTGTLPVANGGTGKTTLEDSANALINGLSTGSSAPEDNDYYVSQYAGGEQNTFHRRPVSALWEYMKGKISSVLGLTASSYSGNSATATKATQDGDGNNIASTYLKAGMWKTHYYTGLNSGKLLMLLEDITEWYNGTSQKYIDLVTIISIERAHWYGNPSTQMAICQAGIGYYGNKSAPHLRTTDSNIRPVIVSKTENDTTTYYLALLSSYGYSSGQFLNMLYSYYVNDVIKTPLLTKITFDASLVVPDGYSIVRDNKTLFIEAAKATSADSATKATQDASGNVITSTYAKKDEIADTYAKKSIYGDTAISMGRQDGSTVGSNSAAFGQYVTASGAGSLAHGYGAVASGTMGCYASGYDSVASGRASHAEGENTIASGQFAHAEGGYTTASGSSSHAEGYKTTALNYQHAQGHFNNTNTATANEVSGTSRGTAFVIGNGTADSASNAFRVTGEGKIYAPNSSIQSGADYAEYFEWADGNLNEEDRVGYFVTFDEDNPEKIRIASKDDYILGIVSGMPNIIGNGDECWKQRYILDDFGRYIEETFEYEVEVPEVVEKEVEDEETGETKIVEEVVIHKETKIGTKWKENPEYDSTEPYIARDKRAEWSAIGMLGVLSVRDDETCQVNGYCKCTDGGIATACEKGEGAYRVIKRVTDNIVKVVLK